MLRANEHNVPEILEEILQVFPLDFYTQYPITLMNVVSVDNVKTPIGGTYKNIMYSSDKLIKKYKKAILTNTREVKK